MSSTPVEGTDGAGCPGRRPRGRPSRIDRAAILAAAGELPAADLTMPALARQLGVATSARYHYFATVKHNRSSKFQHPADYRIPPPARVRGVTLSAWM
ncbi:hypothetical protein ATK36_4787 [Amycolatopsis sulphurea]|uniref:Uncharacterized protein n=1 Tax=Amycolatopsis sulphurea TaxID=76022 RepID=A0A2A9FGR2_9PSEU|nr:hypothetical protein [Amycolatopsis sulphurea]PFG49625.1 hypothetical protein ATK36_4787 [Amycolatopsis sulphurea]